MVSEEETQAPLRGVRIACDNVVGRVKRRKIQSVVMETLKKGIFHSLSISPFHQRRSSERKKQIEDSLCALIPEILPNTPNHPPYAEMIERAIERSEEEVFGISSYIRSTYRDLPWAHSHLLPFHLRKFTESGEIIAASPNSRYLLPLSNPSLSPYHHHHHQQPRNNEPSQRPQPPKKRGRGNHSKKTRSEQQEIPQEEQLETEKQHQKPRGGLGQQKHPEEAIRTKEPHFDGEGSIVHHSEPPNVGSGEKRVMEIDALNMEIPKLRRSRHGQKQPFPLLNPCSSPVVPMYQPTNYDTTRSMVSCCEPIVAAVEKKESALIYDEEEPLQMVLPQIYREQMKLAEKRTTASDSNDSMMVLSSGQTIAAMVDKEASASVCEDEEPFQTQKKLLLPSPHRDEELNHPEVKRKRRTPKMVLSVAPLMVVDHAVKEKENPGEQPPQQQQMSLQCTDDDDDDIMEFCWNPKSVRKEKEGMPNKQSEPTRRRSLRLAELYQQGKETFVMKVELKEEEKQPSLWLQKPKKIAKHFKKEKKELGKKRGLSQQQQQLKRHREEQTELQTEIEPSQKKRRDKHSMEDPKEMETETELSQQQIQLQQNQKALKGKGKRGRPPNGPGVHQKQREPKGQGESIEKESNRLGKKTRPLHFSVAVEDGDVQSGKSQMAEINQDPSELQKKASGQGRPPNMEAAEATVKVQG